MKYWMMVCTVLLTFAASAETISGRITKVRDNVAFLQTADGKKIPVILNDKTYYRKKKVLPKGRRMIEAQEYYQPLIERGDDVTLTYDADTVDETTGAVKASDVLVITN